MCSAVECTTIRPLPSLFSSIICILSCRCDLWTGISTSVLLRLAKRLSLLQLQRCGARGGSALRREVPARTRSRSRRQPADQGHRAAHDRRAHTRCYFRLHPLKTPTSKGPRVLSFLADSINDFAVQYLQASEQSGFSDGVGLFIVDCANIGSKTS